MEAINYWFSLKSHVYVEFKNCVMLLYNTQTGDTIEEYSKDAISLVMQMREPDNLGVILYDEELQTNSEIHTFVQNVVERQMGDLWKCMEGYQKPVRLYPFLNLQKDVDRLKKGEENNLILGKDIINYLFEMNIYLNDFCNHKTCEYCKEYCKQIHCCTSNQTGTELSVNCFEKIFHQIKYSPIGKINLLGGNIFKYKNFIKIYDILESMKEIIHCYIHYKIYEKDKYINTFPLELIVSFPVDEISLKRVWSQIDRKNTSVQFIIENKVHYYEVKEWIRQFNLEKFDIHPFFSGKNLDFFKDNIFVGKEEILSNTLQIWEIFRNQKLNSNFFGALYVLPDGTVKADMNTEALGNLKETTILDVIYKELIENTAWRKVRDMYPCSDCIYQYICPAPSNYEISIGKPNLCHINNDE